MASLIPAVVEPHLDAIHCTKDGKIILSSSNLTGRYWNGSLWCFKNVEDAPDVEKCVTGISITSGICDFVYLETNIAILGLDSGGIDVYKLESHLVEKRESFTCVFGATEHDDFISSLDFNSDKSNLVTVGADKCVKIWDKETWATTATYRPIHNGRIWQVSCSTTDPSIFVTCGEDGKVLMFDLRLPKPALVIETPTLKGEPTSVAWKPSSSSTFAVGDESGQICVKDIRQSDPVCSWKPHKRRVTRMVFSSDHPWIASCADDTNVCITKLNESTTDIIYEDDRHDDFVRGLSWNSAEELVSCGWDFKVLNHICKKEPTE